MTYDEWYRCERRDQNPVEIIHRGNLWILYDHVFNSFVLPDTRQIITVEMFLDAFRRA